VDGPAAGAAAGTGSGVRAGAAADADGAAGFRTLQSFGGFGGFTLGILVFTKTVKAPGASPKVAVPQRLGVLSPSRRMRSTLKVAEPACSWQVDSLSTLICKRGRFASAFERRARP